MTVEISNPAAIHEPTGYAHVAVATGTKLVFLAGQVALDPAGELVGRDDLAAQVEQALLNMGAALDHAGAALGDVAKLAVYVVDWAPEKIEQINAGVLAAAGKLGGLSVVPSTLIGVQALGDPGFLVEIEATAVID